jgi:hypothetical protein
MRDEQPSPRGEVTPTLARGDSLDTYDTPSEALSMTCATVNKITRNLPRDRGTWVARSRCRTRTRETGGDVMLRKMLYPALTILLTMFSTGCSTTVTTDAPQDEPGPVADQLIAMGFEPDATAIPAADAPEGESASRYTHADGRFALLISNELGDDADGLVFDSTGEFQARLSPDSADVAYCLTCDLGYWACYGSCAAPCWSDLGFGQGCHTDCNDGCTYFYWACDDEYCH